MANVDRDVLVNAFREFIKVSEEGAENLTNRGALYLSLGDKDRASNDFASALSLAGMSDFCEFMVNALTEEDESATVVT